MSELICCRLHLGETGFGWRSRAMAVAAEAAWPAAATYAGVVSQRRCNQAKYRHLRRKLLRQEITWHVVKAEVEPSNYAAKLTNNKTPEPTPNQQNK